MPSFSAEVPHNLGQQAAIERLTSMMGQIESQYGDQISDMEASWTGNQLHYSFTTFSFGIEGTMTVNEKTVRVDGQIPFAVMMFRGTIEKQLTTELQKALA